MNLTGYTNPLVVPGQWQGISKKWLPYLCSLFSLASLSSPQSMVHTLTPALWAGQTPEWMFPRPQSQAPAIIHDEGHPCLVLASAAPGPNTA